MVVLGGRRKRKWRVVLGLYLGSLTLSHLFCYLSSPPEPPLSWATFTDGDVEMSYRELGAPEKRTLLLLHGSPMASSSFDQLIADLGADYHLLVPDLPGFGYSQQSGGGVSIIDHAEVLASWLEERAISDVIVVGYSMGGGVALHLEELVRDRISGIVLLASIGVQEHELLGDYALNHMIHGAQLVTLRIAKWVLPHFGLLQYGVLNERYARNFYESDQRPLRDRLMSLNGPTLIIHGESDWQVPVRAAREHHRIVPQSELVSVDGAGHLILHSHAAEVGAAIRNFTASDMLSKRRSTASPERIALAEESPDPHRLDASIGSASLVAVALGLATLFSEDIACISGGLLAGKGVISFFTAVLGCYLGIFVGDLWLFWMGRTGSSWLQRLPGVARYWEKTLRFSENWVERNAPLVVISSRFIPGSRLPTYLALGMSGLPMKRFILWFAFAVLLWTPLLVGVSFWAGGYLLPIFEEKFLGLFFGSVAIVLCVFLLSRAVGLVVTWRGRKRLKGIWLRWTHWEFWPSWVIYSMLLPHLVSLMVRHRSMTLFALANPALPCGGFAYEPKQISLLALRKSGSVASFQIIQEAADMESFADEVFARSGRLVLKPDCGERGRGVSICDSLESARADYEARPDGMPSIAQEYVGGLEYGVFYYRFPNEKRGSILGVTHKDVVSVVGDGERTLEELILGDDRAVVMSDYFLDQYKSQRWDVIPAGEEFRLSQLGTHSRGAIFRNASHLSTSSLVKEIDRIAQTFDGFYFGRFDLKAPSSEALSSGDSLSVLELNGVTSEATHLYDPSHSLSKGLAILKDQWNIAFEIGSRLAEQGMTAPTIFDLIENVQKHRKAGRHEVGAVLAKKEVDRG